METVKYNDYIALANAINGRFSSSLERYENYYGLEEELQFGKHDGYLYEISQYDVDIIEAALSFAGEEPAMPALDSAVKNLAPKMLDMISLINEMNTYYDLKNYIDDVFILRI
ncbi:MAG: YiiG family protein [Oscillospiraceae bacterium]|jgi:hypothetical protein|nr:YiiG family protein [Oscillospiraceae bacterium]